MRNYWYFFLFFIVSLVFSVGLLGFVALIRYRRRPVGGKCEPYECGVDPATPTAREIDLHPLLPPDPRLHRLRGRDLLPLPLGRRPRQARPLRPGRGPRLPGHPPRRLRLCLAGRGLEFRRGDE
ncbi:MAG: hypothetical protein MZV64_18070 [Ignavibacteriales bacterium]|nr:hypothetical protein [Ignavibacteriales bacterium]